MVDYVRTGPYVNNSATRPVNAAALNHFEDTFDDLYQSSPSSVIYHGADRTGASDDTAAFDACMANAFSAVVRIPLGSFNYNGTGFNANTSTSIVIEGIDPYHSVVNLGPTSRLIDIGTGTVNAIKVSNIGTNGGVGVFRSLYTGPQVSGMYLFENCQFNNYTGCCIEKNAQDWPNWTFRDCQFFGANWTTTIGIASNGLTDGLNIENCSFPRNRVGIKLGYGGNNTYIHNCGFIHADPATRPASTFIWVVPQNTSSSNAGAGMVVSQNRFGSENFNSTDYYTIYADEDTGSGTSFGTRFPDLTTASTGRIDSHTFTDNLWLGTDGMQGSLIYSMTPNVYSLQVDGVLSGTMPNYVLQYLNPPLSGPDSTHIMGGFRGVGVASSVTAGPKWSNDDGGAAFTDPNQILDTRFNTFTSAPGGADPVAYVNLMQVTPQTATLSGVTRSNVTNVYGETSDAAQFTFSSGGTVTFPFNTNPSTGRPSFLEFDAKASSLTTVRARIFDGSGNLQFSKTVTMGGLWDEYPFRWAPRASGSGWKVVFDLPLGGMTGSIYLGRVHVYHNRERLNLSGVTVIAGQRVKLGLTGGNVTYTAV